MRELLPEPAQRLSGAIIEVGIHRKVVYLAGVLPEKLPGIVLHRGEIAIRYAVPFVYEIDSFFIQRLVDDFGRDFRGQEAINFAYQKGDAYPRATVIGIRASSGGQEQIFLKQLDLARAMIPVAYRDSRSIQPIAQIDAAGWLDIGLSGLERLEGEAAQLPIAMVEALPTYRLPPSALGEIERIFG